MRTQLIDLRNGHIVDVYGSGVFFWWSIIIFKKERIMYEVFDPQTHQWFTLHNKFFYPATDESVKALQTLVFKKAPLGNNIISIQLSNGKTIVNTGVKVFKTALIKQIEINRLG